MRLDDPDYVRAQYATSGALAGRVARWDDDPDRGAPHDVIVAAVAAGWSLSSTASAISPSCGTLSAAGPTG